MESINQSNYLGKEKLSKLLARFAIPCILSLIISCLYNIVDQIFIGNMIGTAGNAATGIIFPITVIGWGASLFFGDGAAAYLSMALGKGESKRIHTVVGNSVLMAFVSGIIITTVAYICGDDLLILLGAKDAETLLLASAYGKIIYAMIPFLLLKTALHLLFVQTVVLKLQWQQCLRDQLLTSLVIRFLSPLWESKVPQLRLYSVSLSAF